MIWEADAYFSHPEKQVIISYIPQSRCLFIILGKTGAYFILCKSLFICGVDSLENL